MEVWVIGARGRFRLDFRVFDFNLRFGFLGFWYFFDFLGEFIFRLFIIVVF